MLRENDSNFWIKWGKPLDSYYTKTENSTKMISKN